MKYLTLLPAVQREIDQHPLTLLLIKSSNCGVCTVIENQLEHLVPEFPNIHAIKANIADIPEMASHFHALTAPVILLFFHGKEVERFARFVPYEDLKSALEHWQQHLD